MRCPRKGTVFHYEDRGGSLRTICCSIEESFYFVSRTCGGTAIAPRVFDLTRIDLSQVFARSKTCSSTRSRFERLSRIVWMPGTNMTRKHLHYFLQKTLISPAGWV